MTTKIKLLASALMVAAPLLAADDPVIRAMRDELARSMKKLQLENFQKPYFIAYRMVDTDSCSATASFGALVTTDCPAPSSGLGRRRALSVEVRVGDYNRDNTNFYAFQLGVAGVVRTFAVGGSGIAVDDNYDEIRRQLWVATDSGYKEALDVYAKKKAALEHRTRTDDAPDFSHEAVVTDSETLPRLELSSADVVSTVKSLSALFKKTPDIDNSEVRLTGTNELIRYINSEGTSFTRQTPALEFTARADTQAADGMPLSDFEVVYARSWNELASRDELAKRIGALQGRLQKLRTAGLVERYTGPVLFEGEAAAELVTQSLGNAILGVPRIVVDDSRFERMFGSNDGTFVDKLGGRVFPDFLSLTDNPTAREFQGKPLFGGYQVDDDGVKPKPTTLVDKGNMKTMLRTRALIHGTNESSGSRRGRGPAPSNLLLSSEKSMTSDQIKAELLRIVKERNKEYGILIRRISDQQLVQSLTRSRTIIITSGGQSTIEIQPVIEAYKVFPDGHEELVRNLNIQGFTLAAFKDILAVSDSPSVNTVPFRPKRVSPVLSGFVADFTPTLVSVVTPSLLFDDLTLQRPTGEIPNLPFTKHPFFEK